MSPSRLHTTQVGWASVPSGASSGRGPLPRGPSAKWLQSRSAGWQREGGWRRGLAREPKARVAPHLRLRHSGSKADRTRRAPPAVGGTRPPHQAPAKTRILARPRRGSHKPREHRQTRCANQRMGAALSAFNWLNAGKLASHWHLFWPQLHPLGLDARPLQWPRLWAEPVGRRGWVPVAGTPAPEEPSPVSYLWPRRNRSRSGSDMYCPIPNRSHLLCSTGPSLRLGGGFTCAWKKAGLLRPCQIKMFPLKLPNLWKIRNVSGSA